MAFGFGFDFCSVELKKYVDSGWVASGSGGWVRVGGFGFRFGFRFGWVGSAEVKD